jgi:hypothetical protein
MIGLTQLSSKKESKNNIPYTYINTIYITAPYRGLLLVSALSFII